MTISIALTQPLRKIRRAEGRTVGTAQSFSFRIVRVETAKVIESVAPDVFDHPIDEGLLSAYLAQDNHLLFVAIDVATVVGQCRGVLIDHPDKGRELFIENLGVAPSHRRRGIGTCLINKIVLEAQARDCARFWVLAEAGNATALAFYRTFDLKSSGLIMFENE